MELKSPLYGVSVRTPVGHDATAVIENLTDSYGLDNLRPLFSELKEVGVRNVVLDLALYPRESRRRWAPFLYGMTSDFETRYIGITAEEAVSEDSSFRIFIVPIIAKSLDAAVESFSQQ